MIPISTIAEKFDILNYFDADGKFKPTSFSISKIERFHVSIRLYYAHFKFTFVELNEIPSYKSFLKIDPKMTLKEYNMIISFYCDPRIQRFISDFENHPIYAVTECTCLLF